MARLCNRGGAEHSLQLHAPLGLDRHKKDWIVQSSSRQE